MGQDVCGRRNIVLLAAEQIFKKAEVCKFFFVPTNLPVPGQIISKFKKYCILFAMTRS